MSSIHDPHYIEVISRLRAAREARGLSQSDLAKSIGRAQSYISKIETGERRIDYVELLTLCKAIGVPLVDITPAEYRSVVTPKDSNG